MNRSTTMTLVALALLLGGAGGCGIFSTARGGPGQVGDLVGWTERLYVESEVSKVKVADALRKLRALTAADFAGDPVVAHTAYVEAIDASERQAQKMRDTIEPMKKAAGPVFDQWAIDLEAYANRSMRERSKARLSSTRARFDAVVAEADPALAGFDEFNRGLRDHALYLANDFNPDAVASISEDVQALARLADEIDGRFDACMRTSREYVVAAAPPSHGASPVDGNAVGGTSAADAGEGAEQPATPPGEAAAQAGAASPQTRG